MSLNKQFFDNISIELVKRKYYNANKVDSLISSIRAEALAMDEELRSLREQLGALQSQKAEISEAVMSAQLMSSDILHKANLKAQDLAAEAEEKAKALLQEAERQAAEKLDEARSEAQSIIDGATERLEKAKDIHAELTGCKQRRQEYAVDKVEACFAMLRQQHQEAIDSLNLKWQEFLCGLYDDDSMPDAALFTETEESGAEESSTEAEATVAVAAEQLISVTAPADLVEKVGAIAKELNELEEG